MSGDQPATVENLLAGQWKGAGAQQQIVDPLNGEPFLSVPATSSAELDAFEASARSCPKAGMHNPLSSPERYLLYGRILHAAGHELARPEVHEFFAKLIARCMPKSYFQAWFETKVTADFLKNWGGDNPRFNAAGFHVAGDHVGQESKGYRWPFGPVAIVAPFNFPLEIPVLQLMGALMMGNRPTLKVDSIVAPVMEQFVRLLMHCGMPATDMDLMHSDGPVMGELINRGPFRTVQFTGSSAVGERLSHETNGKVKLEDAGFDWKILGPDVSDVDYVAWVADQDAYACTGQKCSAQSVCFVHENWAAAGIVDKMAALAARRNFEDLSVGPVMTHTTEDILSHTERLLEIPGARLVFGGKALTGHTVPPQYGMVEPTAVFVPLEEMLKEEHFETCTREVFGPFQVITEYDDATLSGVLSACERMKAHLTAAVVSNDPRFQTKVLGATVNGTTYTGIRARTTGAPQNHWFGPGNDPRGAGIGSPYAIQLVWSCHREIIHDSGEVPDGWTAPPPS